MTGFSYLYQLFLKNENDSFFNLFLLKFKNLLDDYIVNYKIKYLFYFLFIFFFFFEISNGFFIFYNTEDNGLLFGYLVDLGDLLFKQNALVYPFYIFFYYLFYTVVLLMDIILWSHLTDQSSILANMMGGLILSFLFYIAVYVLYSSDRLPIFTMSVSSFYSFFSFSFSNVVLFICFIFSFFFPYVGILLLLALCYSREMLLEQDKNYDNRLFPDFDLKTQIVECFTDPFYLTLWFSLVLIFIAPMYALGIYSGACTICSYITLCRYFIKK